MNAQRMNENPATLRLPQDLLDRADKLIGKLDHLPEFAMLKVNRSTVLRLALIRGLALLEVEAKAKR